MVELLIAITITGIIGTILVTILVQNHWILVDQGAKIDQGLSLEKTYAQISDSVKTAASVKNSCPQPPCNNSYTSNPDTLVLALPSLDVNGNVIKDVYDYLVIKADNDNERILRKMVFVDPLSNRKSENMVLTTSLSLISFYYFDQNNNIVNPTEAKKVNFIVNQMHFVGNREEVSSGSATVSIRNF